MNITIRDFSNIYNFTRGIYFDRVNDSVIVNNTMNSQIAQTTYAIYLEDGDSNVIENNSIEWNATSSTKGFLWGLFYYEYGGFLGWVIM